MTILVLEGNIGVTKTTIGNSIINKLRQKAVVYSSTAYMFEERKVFKFIFIPEDLNDQKLTEFYNNPSESSFEFQKYMLQRSIENYQKAIVFSEYGYLVLLDRNLIGYTVFLKVLHKQRHITTDQYDYLTNEVKKINPEYDGIIYIQDNLLECLKRIRRRNRPYEQDITMDYLLEIGIAYNQIINQYDNVHEFHVSESVEDTLVNIIKPYINQLSGYV